MTFNSQPFAYLHLEGVPKWTESRKTSLALQLTTIEQMVPAELVTKAVANLIDDVLRHISTSKQDPDRRTTPANLIRMFLKPRSTARKRVILYQLIITIKHETSVAIYNSKVWKDFVTVETDRAIKQIVQLWIDFLLLARSRVNPYDDLLLEPSMMLPGSDIEHGLMITEGDWVDQFIELLSMNCCILPQDMQAILVKFFDNVNTQIDRTNWWSMNLIAESGNILRLVKTKRGQLVIPTGHPNDLDERTMPHPASWPERQLPHSWAIKRLDLLAQQAKLCSDIEARSAELAILRDRATNILEQLKETTVPPSAKPTLESVLVHGGIILFPAYSGSWLTNQLNAIFPDA